MLSRRREAIASSSGFRLGSVARRMRSVEAARESRESADGEIDMVINVGALKSKTTRTCCATIEAVVEASKAAGGESDPRDRRPETTIEGRRRAASRSSGRGSREEPRPGSVRAAQTVHDIEPCVASAAPTWA